MRTTLGLFTSHYIEMKLDYYGKWLLIRTISLNSIPWC